MREAFVLDNFQPTFKTRLDELSDDERALYDSLFGGSFEQDRQAAIERAAFYERLNASANQEQVAEPAPEDGRGILGAAKDLGLSVAGGFANMAGALTQVADMSSLVSPMSYAGRAIGDSISRETGLPTSDDMLNAGREAAGTAERYLSDQKSDYSKSQAQAVQDADGFWGTTKAYIENPGQIAEGVAGSLPYMLPVGYAARAAKAAQMSAGGVASTAAGAGAVMEGGAAGSQANSEVMSMTAGELLERSPDYAKLISGGVDAEEAKSIVASRAGFTAQALQMPISFLASKLSGAAKLESDYFTGNQARGLLNLFPMVGKEAAEEIIQEGANQASVNYGVQQFGDNSREVMAGVPEAAASGMVIGAGQAAGMKGTGWAVNKVLGDPSGSRVDDDGDVDLPRNGEQLRNLGGVEVGGGIVDDLPDNMRSIGPVEVDRPLLRETGSPDNPDDRYKFELDTDSFVSNLRRRLDEQKAKSLQQSSGSQDFRAELDGPDTTLADVARQFGEANGFIQKPIAYDGGINFERTPVPRTESQGFSLAPLDVGSNAIEFTRTEAPARTNELAGAVEKAISANIDKARNSRMPENLKDVRLLRSRYRTHLNDVLTGLDSNAGAFEKADSLLEMAAKNGGLNADAWASEGVDPADIKNANGAVFTKAFRSDGGMTPDDLAEFAAQNGFQGFTDESGAPVSGAAIEAVLGELSGNKRFSTADEEKLQSAQAAPDFIKELAELGSPSEIKTAVNKALAGEKLGDRQVRIVQEILDSTNRFKRDDSAVIEKWEARARTMLSNKGNRALDEWRNRDEHSADATTEEAALNEIMTDAMMHHGIEPDKIKSAYEKYAQQYPDSMGKLTYAMMAWVSANKPSSSEQSNNERQVPVQGSPSQRRETESRAGLSPESQAAETAAAPGRIESRTPAQPGSDSAGRDAGLRQSVDLPEGWDKSLLKARPVAKSLGIPDYNKLKLGELVSAVNFAQTSATNVDIAAGQAATSPLNDLPEPTAAQKEAGNYKKAHVSIQGLDIAIENARGSTRSGQDAKGKKWSVDMQHHYGYIKRTEGADGDHVDVFVGTNPESEKVFVVDQINEDGSFDEHKVMLGFDSQADAVEGYRANYSAGWKVGPITSMTMGEFKEWVKSGDTKKPLSDQIADAGKMVSSQSEQLPNMVPTQMSEPKPDQTPVKQTENNQPQPSAGVSVSGAGISAEDAQKLTADLKRLSRTPDFETDGSRYPAFAKQIDKAVAGDADAVKWAKEWLADIDEKQRQQKASDDAQREAAASKRQADEKSKADAEAERLDMLSRGEIPPDTQEVYAEWVKSLTDVERKKLFSPETSNAARNAAFLARKQPSEATKPAYKRPESEVQYQSELQARLRAGEVSIDEFKEAFSSLTDDREQMMTQLSSLTKDKLIDLISGYSAIRAKSEKKDYAIRAAYESLITQYYYAASNSSMFSYSGGSKDYIQGKIDAVKPFVDAATQKNLDAYAEEYADAIKEREENKRRKTEGMQDPKTLEDFRNLHRAILNENENMSQADARMQMSVEQRAEYDRLSAIETRAKRIGEKDERKTQVSSGEQLVSGSIIETKHTKKGHDLFVVQLDTRVSKEDYTTLAASAKKLGGYYSGFRGGGAVPGFQFTTSDDARAFLDLAGGNTEAASEIAKEKRDAFEDDKSQSTAERLRTMAAAMRENAENELSRDRKSNTQRRAGMAARALDAAEREKAMAETMVRIADGIESGELTFLDKLRTKAQLSQIQAALHVAKGDEIRKKYDSYAEQLKHEGEPITAETVDYAVWPTYTAYRSDLAKLARQMIETDGLKKLGNDLLKVADDTSAEYQQFAKDNLNKVATFQNKDGAPAVFKTKKAAALSIEGSGFSGKAIPFEVKRGEHLIILSPSEAAVRGIWSGADKKITLTPDFVEELIEKAAKKNRKKENVSVPWQFETAYEKRQRYKSMGIETAAEFRAALREYVGIAKQPGEMDKVKKLELAMVGRKKDGLDFFPTPQAVADEMINAAGIQAGMSVLEPSAGMGHIADRIRAFGVEPDVVEISNERRELLEAKGYNLVGMDFIEYTNRDTFGFGDTFRAEDGSEGILRGQGGLGSDRVRLVDENGEGVGKKFFSMEELTPVRKNGAGSGYDRIIMNPPFSDRRDMDHVLHAYDLLKPGGRIVAIVGEGVMFGSDKKATEFRAWLDELGATAEKLEEGTFNDPSLPVTTGVNARMLVIDKPEQGEILYSLQKDSPRLPRITRDAAQAVIDRISKDWKVPVKVSLIESINDLPNSIKSRMNKDDGGAEPAALIDESSGHVYINLSKVDSERSIEELIFHEVYTHFGLRQLMGDDVGPVMGRLYMSLGAAEVDRLAKKHGVNLEAYEKAYEGRPVEMRRAILAEELLAHMAEHPKPTVVRLAQEFIGAVRAWLRKNGFAELSEISDSDMRYLLKQARETVTKGKRGDISGLIYSLSGLTKQDRRALNQQRKQPFPEANEQLAEMDELITAWAYISQREESFQLPTSRKTDLVEIAQDIEGMNGFVVYEADELALMNDHDAENAWRIKTPGGAKAAVFQKGDKVWIDVSDLESGDDGKRIYNIVANYAFNTDRVFMGDPAGLSIMAKYRRLENMLSSAMKFGTTRHLQPHRLQLKDGEGVPGLKWKKGDDLNNIREMIIASYEAVKNQFPKIEDLAYNPEKDIFEDSTNGREFTRQDFRELAETARGLYEQGAGGIAPSAGRTTLERAVLTNSVLRGTRSERSKLLERLGSQRSERLKNILYRLPSDNEETRPSGGFSFGRSKIKRGATLPHQLKDAYNQLGGGHKTLYEKVKTEVKRQLAPRGLLPREIFDLKIARDGAMNADDSQQRFILTDFYEQIQAVYHKPYHELKASTRKEINDYLKGDRTDVQLTDSMVNVLARMRTQIQSLSRSYINELLLDAANLEAQGKTEAAEVKRALIETITENFDSYLHRSYRAFDDPDWPKKVPEDVYQNAVNFLARQYAGDAKPTAEHIDKATKKVDLMLHEGTAYDSIGRFISESKLGSKDLSVIKKRKQIAPEIRALLGEYEDPAINYAKSVTKMTRLVHNTAFLRQMTDLSLELGYIFEEENRPLGANKKIAADASEVYAPLNGMYTFPEFEQALRDAVGASKEPDWYKVLVAANGAVKYGKTVLAPTTAVRNFLSASMFALTSGHWSAAKLEKSVKVVKTYFTGKDVRGSREYINKLLKLGVLYDAPNYRELQDLIKSVNESEHWLAQATRKSKLGAVLNYAQEFYALGDDFWKILGFENEKAMLIKHYGMTEAAAEKEAAERIRNTYPTYSLTGKGIQALRRFPVIGSFPSFPAEIIRTTFHKFRYFHKDAKALGKGNPAVLAKGFGLILGAGMMAGLSYLSAAMFGVDDDEEEAIRQMLPEWSKNSSLFFLGRDENGQVQYMDLGWLDPYGYWKKPLSALARDASMGDKLSDAAWEALSPFLGLDIAAGTLGEYVYDAFFNESITTEKANEKLIKGLAPGAYNNALGFWEAAHETVTKSGKKYNFEDEALALVGFRKGTLNTKVGLTYQAYGYSDKKRQAATVLRDKATDMGKVDIEELRAAYEKSMGMQRDAWNDMRRTVKMAMKTGMTQSEAIAALRTSGMSLQDARGIVADREFVYRPSKTMMKLAIKRAGILFDKEAQAELRERQKRLQELQREYLEVPVR